MKKKLLALILTASLSVLSLSQGVAAFEDEGDPLGFLGFLQEILNSMDTEDWDIEETPAPVPDDDVDLPSIGGIGSGVDIIGLPTQEDVEETVYAIALDDINISIWTDEFVAMREDEDGFFYVYTIHDESIPYVIIGSYDIAYNRVVDSFTRLMQKSYADLDVDFLHEGIQIGDYEFTKVIYRYKISGYDAVDTRLFCEIGSRSYMFGMKEIEALNYTVGEDYLEAIAESAAILAGGYNDYPYHVEAGKPLFFEDIENIEKPTAEEPTKETGFNEEDAPYEGAWFPFEDGFELYLPVDWTFYEVTEQQQQNGVLMIVGDSSIVRDTPFVSVTYAYDEDLVTLDDFSEFLDEAGYVVDEIGFVNDIECVVYHTPDNSTKGELYLYPGEGFDGYLFTVVANSYQSADEECDAILASLRLTK